MLVVVGLCDFVPLAGLLTGCLRFAMCWVFWFCFRCKCCCFGFGFCYLVVAGVFVVWFVLLLLRCVVGLGRLLFPGFGWLVCRLVVFVVVAFVCEFVGLLDWLYSLMCSGFVCGWLGWPYSLVLWCGWVRWVALGVFW